MQQQRLSPEDLRTMADTSGDPIIRRALQTLAEDVEEEQRFAPEDRRDA